MKRGVAVRGGHRHHLKVINTIRRYGSIAKAVEAGVIKSGVMYECVQNNIPFSLAGSIRDDGPLPDTQMDLIQAQEEYAKHLRRCRNDFDAVYYAALHWGGEYDSRWCENGVCGY